MGYKDPQEQAAYKRWHDAEHKEERLATKNALNAKRRKEKTPFQRLSKQKRRWVMAMNRGVNPLQAALKVGYKRPMVALSANRGNEVIQAALSKWRDALGERELTPAYWAGKLKVIMDKTTKKSATRRDSNTLKALVMMKEAEDGGQTGGAAQINVFITPAEAKFMSQNAELIDVEGKVIN